MKKNNNDRKLFNFVKNIIMKSLIIVAVSLVCLCSCSKKYNYTCTTEPSAANGRIVVEKQMTERQKNKFEKENTNSNYDSIWTDGEKETVCVKK